MGTIDTVCSHTDDGTGAGDERGASAVEYALLVAGIAAMLVVVILLLGGRVQGLFSETCDVVSASGTCS